MTIHSPVLSTLLDKSSTKIGYAAKEAETKKIQKYGVECQRKLMRFVLFAMETFGGFGPCAVEIVCRTGKSLAEKCPGLSVGDARRRIFSKLSCLTQQSLAEALINIYIGPLKSMSNFQSKQVQ